MKGMRRLYFTMVLLVGMSACNVARYHTRVCHSRLERIGYSEHLFKNAAGDHHVWLRDTGKKKLLLLHGYTGTGAMQWSRTAHLLSKDHDAIIPDLLCHGKSTTVWHGNNMDAQVDHIVLILDSAGVTGPIPVVGNSYGGGVAAYLAEQHPERVEKLVIYDGLVSDYTSRMADSIARSVGGSSMLAVMSTPTYRDLRMGIRLSLYRNIPIPGFILKQVFEESVRPFRPAQVTLIKDLMDHEDRYTTKRFTWSMPVHLIWGERDRLIPNSVGEAIMQRNGIPIENLTIIPRTGHVANLERPKAFDRALREILAK